MKKMLIIFFAFSTFSNAQIIGVVGNGQLVSKTNTIPSGDTTPPTAPSSLVVSSVAETTATLTWNASTDANGISYYRIYNNDVSLVTSTGSNATTYNLTGLTPNTSYTITVRGVDPFSNISANSNSQTFTTTNYDPTANFPFEDEYFAAYYVPVSDKLNINTRLATHGSIRLGAGDYQSGGVASITLGSNKKIFGFNDNTMPQINISAGATNFLVKNVKAWYGIVFQAGAAITNGSISQVAGGYMSGANASIENVDFIDIVGTTFNFDQSTSGYFRNNRIIKHWATAGLPQLKLKGNNTTPSYGNTWAWLALTTSQGDATDFDNIDDLNIIGLDAEAWNYGGLGTGKALLYMRNMGEVNFATLSGLGYASSPTPVFDIAADNLSFVNHKLSAGSGGNSSFAGGNSFLLGSNTNNYSQTGVGFAFKGHVGGTTATYNGASQTALITGTPATNLTNAILKTERTPWTRPTFQQLPDPTGASWATVRVGQTSDRAYIQGLIDANKIAELDEGIYYIDAPLLVNKDDGIIGKGTGKTAIVGLTDDFNLINVRGAGIGRFTLKHMTLQGGSKAIHITSDGYDVWFQPNNIDVRYLVIRDQATYGIEVAQMYGMDNNIFEQVHFENIPIGFKQTPDPAYAGGETNHMTYIDKTVFYNCQAINCGIGYSLLTARADNLDAWIDCNFDGNGIAIDMVNHNAPIVVNCDFKNTTGAYVIRSLYDLGLYSCNFSGNTTTNLLAVVDANIEGCNFLDNRPLFSSEYATKAYIVNSTVTGTYGTMANGMFINSNMQSNPEVNYLLVNRVSNTNTVLLNAAPNPYPQLLVKH